MGLIIKKPDDAIIVNKKDGTHVAYYLFDEYDSLKQFTTAN